MKKKKPINLVRDSKGQGVMEYVIISSLIGIVCLIAVQSFGKTIKKRIGWMESTITDRIERIK